MNELNAYTSDILPPDPIRVETALSRYPVHRLAKHGEVAIDIRERNKSGEVSIKWRVTYNTGFGQPGPLAYKLDTLIINRRIEEAPRPIPRIIRLGSHREICHELGIADGGRTLEQHKKAFHQNASAYITATINYRSDTGTEQNSEIGDTRYGVVFTGEKLPDGRTADAVYIVLHDFYREILDKSITRPLDYSYLKSLPPAPQRFYELLSYQMYATIKNDRARAKLLYSEFCTYAPLTRHVNWEHARKQMAKIHAPHQKSGYIAKIDFEQTVDADGVPDWIMLYQPGPKARAEYRAFTKRGGPVMLEAEPLTSDPVPQIASPDPSPLVATLTGHGITEAISRQLVAEYAEDKIRLQVEILGWHAEKKPGKISDPAAWLVIAIKNGHATPKGFVSAAERQRQNEAKREKERRATEARRIEQAKAATDRREREMIAAYWAGLSKQEQAKLEAKATAQADADTLALMTGPMRKFGLQILRDQHIRKLLQAEGKLPPDVE